MGTTGTESWASRPAQSRAALAVSGDLGSAGLRQCLCSLPGHDHTTDFATPDFGHLVLLSRTLWAPPSSSPFWLAPCHCCIWESTYSTARPSGEVRLPALAPTRYRAHLLASDRELWSSHMTLAVHLQHRRPGSTPLPRELPHSQQWLHHTRRMAVPGFTQQSLLTGMEQFPGRRCSEHTSFCSGMSTAVGHISSCERNC